jgi:hypothetical protein
MALRDGIKSPDGARTFSEGLYAWLYGPETAETRFNVTGSEWFRPISSQQTSSLWSVKSGAQPLHLDCGLAEHGAPRGARDKKRPWRGQGPDTPGSPTHTRQEHNDSPKQSPASAILATPALNTSLSSMCM